MLSNKNPCFVRRARSLRETIFSFCGVWFVYVGLLWGCDHRQPDDYQIGRSLPAEAVLELTSQAVRGLEAPNKQIFSVVKMEGFESYKLSLLDGFLYERKFVVLHLDAELKFLREYDVPSRKELTEQVGRPKWSMARSGLEFQRADLLRGDGRNGAVRFEAGGSWRGRVTAVFDDLGGRYRLRHVGQFHRFRHPEREGAGP